MMLITRTQISDSRTTLLLEGSIGAECAELPITRKPRFRTTYPLKETLSCIRLIL